MVVCCCFSANRFFLNLFAKTHLLSFSWPHSIGRDLVLCILFGHYLEMYFEKKVKMDLTKMDQADLDYPCKELLVRGLGFVATFLVCWQIDFYLRLPEVQWDCHGRGLWYERRRNVPRRRSILRPRLGSWAHAAAAAEPQPNLGEQPFHGQQPRLLLHRSQNGAARTT